MSGYSVFSASRTSPIDMYVRAAIVPSLSGEEHQLELADLQLVTGGELRLVDALPVDVGAVEASVVVEVEPVVSPADLGVAAGHGHVVEKDVALRVAACRGDVLVDQEVRSGVRPPPHDHEGLPRVQLVERERDLLARLLLDLDRGERRRAVLLEWSPTVQTEVGVVRISMSTSRAEHRAPPGGMRFARRLRLRAGRELYSRGAGQVNDDWRIPFPGRSAGPSRPRRRAWTTSVGRWVPSAWGRWFRDANGGQRAPGSGPASAALLLGYEGLVRGGVEHLAEIGALGLDRDHPAVAVGLFVHELRAVLQRGV